MIVSVFRRRTFFGLLQTLPRRKMELGSLAGACSCLLAVSKLQKPNPKNRTFSGSKIMSIFNFSFFSDFGLVFFGADFGVFWVISWATDAIGAENNDKYDS